MVTKSIFFFPRTRQQFPTSTRFCCSVEQHNFHLRHLLLLLLHLFSVDKREENAVAASKCVIFHLQSSGISRDIIQWLDLEHLELDALNLGDTLRSVAQECVEYEYFPDHPHNED